jgi:hypothetical protein
MASSPLLAQPKHAQDEHDHDDQADEVDDAVHGFCTFPDDLTADDAHPD